jgi:hypothetical protein
MMLGYGGIQKSTGCTGPKHWKKLLQKNSKNE